MSKKYLDYITDEHLLKCIENMYFSYLKAKARITKQEFYSNKIDTFKLTFDAKFNGVTEKELIRNEIIRQVDKSLNNAIGTFHEEILGGIYGIQRGHLSGWDIKSTDNKIFADIKNKHNTMNSSSAESLFQKLERIANENKNAKCYWVQILAKSSFCENWAPTFNGREYQHKRVFKISGDQFYNLLAYKKTTKGHALLDLYKVLPQAITEFMSNLSSKSIIEEDRAFREILDSSEEANRSVLDQITFENFISYIGFDEL
jgi:hypothetical protein